MIVVQKCMLWEVAHSQTNNFPHLCPFICINIRKDFQKASPLLTQGAKNNEKFTNAFPF